MADLGYYPGPLTHGDSTLTIELRGSQHAMQMVQDAFEPWLFKILPIIRADDYQMSEHVTGKARKPCGCGKTGAKSEDKTPARDIEGEELDEWVSRLPA